MDKRLYPISEEFFNDKINPLIVGSYSQAGRPPRITNYQVFCSALYVLRTGSSWRDLPKNYGYWHSVYLRFKKSSDRGLWWTVLQELQGIKPSQLIWGWMHYCPVKNPINSTVQSLPLPNLHNPV